MLSFTSFLTLLALPLAVRSCGHHTSHHHVARASSPYSYDPPTGPQSWHNLHPNYFLCGNGTMQAPTVISSTSTPTIPATQLKVVIPAAENVLFENVGTTVEVVTNGTLVAEGLTYNLKQFHFHTPSEHRVDGLGYAMEMHFVFQTSDSKDTAVVAFLLELGPFISHDPVLDTLASYVGKISKPDSYINLPKIDMAHFLEDSFKEDARFYSLTQSLTTPPCTEGIKWYIATKPIPLAVLSWKKFKNVIKFNSRPTQGAL